MPNPTPSATAETSCDAQADGLVPVLQVDLPLNADWADQQVPYSFDNTAAVSNGFDRVGYCLETDGAAGPQWVWAAMEPFTTDATELGLPTMHGQIFRQRVDDLDVASNVPSVTTGPGQSGYIEMWPNSYGTAASGQIANASAQTYDADDSPNANNWYGSFQVHSVGAARDSEQVPSTVLSVDRFTQPGTARLCIGIGPNPSGNPDWTHASNAAALSKRTLTVFARPSLVSVTASPQDGQLYPRDEHNGATVPIRGEVIDDRVRTVHLTMTSDGETEYSRSEPAGRFEFSPRVHAGLHEHRFTLTATGPGIRRTVGVWSRVVAGDVYVVQGQSNAVATRRVGTAAGAESPFIRSFGSPNPDPTLSVADRTWNDGTGDLANQPGSIGQWAVEMARRIVDTYRVPVAVINGAHGGQPIAFFQRNDTDPDDPTTNYGRLRQRLAAADVLPDIRGVLWYQGEADRDNAAVHVAGFSALLDGWRSEFGADLGGSAYFVYQVRTSPCNNSTAVNLREAQRELGDTHNVTLLSTTGLDGHDGCHYAWEEGYREMGDHTFAVVARDLYGGPTQGVAPPNPANAWFSNDEQTQITIQLRSDDPLTVDPGVGADFRVNGTIVTVTDVTYQEGGRLVLTLSAPATGATGVSYLSHIGAGPWITNATGTGLLAFGGLPLT